MILYYIHNTNDLVSKYDFPIKQGDICFVHEKNYEIKTVYIDSPVEDDSIWRDFRFLDTNSIKGYGYPDNSCILCKPYKYKTVEGNPSLLQKMIADCKNEWLMDFLAETKSILAGLAQYWTLKTLRRFTGDNDIKEIYEDENEQEDKQEILPAIHFIPETTNISSALKYYGVKVGDFCLCKSASNIVFIEIDHEPSNEVYPSSFRKIEYVFNSKISFPTDYTLLYGEDKREIRYLERFFSVLKSEEGSLLFRHAIEANVAESLQQSSNIDSQVSPEIQENTFTGEVVNKSEKHYDYLVKFCLEALGNYDGQINDTNLQILGKLIKGLSVEEVANQYGKTEMAVRHIAQNIIKRIRKDRFRLNREIEKLQKQNTTLQERVRYLQSEKQENSFSTPTFSSQDRKKQENLPEVDVMFSHGPKVYNPVPEKKSNICGTINYEDNTPISYSNFQIPQDDKDILTNNSSLKENKKYVQNVSLNEEKINTIEKDKLIKEMRGMWNLLNMVEHNVRLIDNDSPILLELLNLYIRQVEQSQKICEHLITVIQEIDGINSGDDDIGPKIIDHIENTLLLLMDGAIYTYRENCKKDSCVNFSDFSLEAEKSEIEDALSLLSSINEDMSDKEKDKSKFDEEEIPPSKDTEDNEFTWIDGIIEAIKPYSVTDLENKPARFGKPWTNEDVVRLVTAYHNNKTIPQLASISMRLNSSVVKKLIKMYGYSWCTPDLKKSEDGRFEITEDTLYSIISGWKSCDREEKIMVMNNILSDLIGKTVDDEHLLKLFRVNYN